MQSYGNVPSVLNVRATDVFDVCWMSAGAPVFRSKITLCARCGNSHRTLPPTGMLTWNGVKTSPGGIVTTARFALAVTFIESVPVAPPARARMLVLPAVTPVTRPDVDTIATIVADELHSNRVLTVLPTESRATAVSCTLSPTEIVGCGEDTKMLATRTDGPLPPSPLQAMNTAQTMSEAIRRIEYRDAGSTSGTTTGREKRLVVRAVWRDGRCHKNQHTRRRRPLTLCM